MGFPEYGRTVAAKVFFEHGSGEPGQIDYYQAVDDAGKCAIDVEREHSTTELKVLPEQHRDSFSVGFEFGHNLRQILQILEQRREQRGSTLT